jgi:ADP-ribose pyrophosphatase YjhB (NUDIX family)
MRAHSAVRARRDYYGDADAPRPSHLVVRIFVAVVDDEGRVLAHQRDSGPWSLPGGALEIGESVEECAARELGEETGARMEGFSVVTALSSPEHVIVVDRGQPPHQQVVILGAGRYAGGELTTSDESPVVAFLAPEEIDDVGFDPAQRGFLRTLAKLVPWVPDGLGGTDPL